MAKEAASFTIRINLLPEELRKKERVRIPLPDLPVGKTIIGFFVLFFLAQVGLLGFSFYQKSRIQGLRADIVKLTGETREVGGHKTEIVAMRERLSEILSLTRREFYWSHLLEALSASAAKGTWFTSLSYQETQETSLASAGKTPASNRAAAKMVRSLRLQGSATGQGQETAYIGKLIKEIKENSFFAERLSDVKLSTINQKKIREFDVYDFVLQCVFRDAEKKNVKA